MMKFKPIDGNGWYVAGNRVAPPPSFYVDTLNKSRGGEINGKVSGKSKVFSGYFFHSVPAFLNDNSFLAVTMDRSEHRISNHNDAEIVGYVRTTGARWLFRRWLGGGIRKSSGVRIAGSE